MAFTRTPRGATHRDRAAAPPRVHRAAPERPPSLGRGLSRHHRLSRARYPSPRPISGSRLTSGAAGGWSYEKLGFGCPDTLAAEGELHEGCRWPSPPSPHPHRPPPGLLPRGGWSHPRGPGARSSFRLDDASPRALTDGSLPSSSLRRLPTGPARPPAPRAMLSSRALAASDATFTRPLASPLPLCESEVSRGQNSAPWPAAPPPRRPGPGLCQTDGSRSFICSLGNKVHSEQTRQTGLTLRTDSSTRRTTCAARSLDFDFEEK